MMSISPQRGHGFVVKSLFAGIIQKAGHVPLPLGSFMRASNHPYFQPVDTLAYTRPEYIAEPALKQLMLSFPSAISVTRRPAACPST